MGGAYHEDSKIGFGNVQTGADGSRASQTFFQGFQEEKKQELLGLKKLLLLHVEE
jgi:hypothetical protein